MGIDIRLPQITGTSEHEQLVQVKSYLYQLAEQLQWGLQNIDKSINTVVVREAETPKNSYSSSLTPKDAQATFAAIKGLIIKSADIVNAYYEEIDKKLTGVYVAQSDFGMFEEQTTQDVLENSTNINRSFKNIQEIKIGVNSSIDSLTDEIGQLDGKVKDVEANISNEIQGLKSTIETLNYSLVEVTANIKSGLLYTNDEGIPVYGLEVGQKNVIDGVEVFNKYARFTAGKLSFYDQNGAEVAYISDYKLYITHAEVRGTLKLGGYLVDTTNGLTFKWVGRG
jgi:hypothetical protein